MPIRFERDARDARIGRLTLANPGKLNAISVAMWRELREHALALDAARPALHAVIVAGEGGAFAAGADIAEFPASRFDVATLRSNTFEAEWPPRSGRMAEFPEIDRADWFAVDEARRRILPGQEPLIDALLAQLEHAVRVTAR